MLLFSIICYLSFTFLGIYVYTSRFFIFSNNPISQILFHVLVQIDGTNPAFLKGIFLYCVLGPLVSTFILAFFFYNKKIIKTLGTNKIYSNLKKCSLLLSVTLLLLTSFVLLNHLDLIGYIKSKSRKTTLYEDEYYLADLDEFTFPENKRNLIYIFLESMEVSNYSKEQGGIFEQCVIPELHELANNNITFNNNQGYHVSANAGWTSAAMLGQQSGTPLTLPIGANDFVTDNKFMPGVVSIGDILEYGGYNNLLIMDCDSIFGGIRPFYEKHGNYKIHDYNYYFDNNYIDYEIWWGFEDYKMFEFAKEDILDLANQNEPFCISIFTMDTHHIGGLECEYCSNEYDDQMLNVFACSSRQISNFVGWIKTQEFGDNTTIILAGDHTSMDPDYDKYFNNYDRKCYYTIINPISSLKPTYNRVLNSFDLFPTTIASLGITWNSNRLGLGTNLYSNSETLQEKYGNQLDSEITKYSSFYNNKLLYGFE